MDLLTRAMERMGIRVHKSDSEKHTPEESIDSNDDNGKFFYANMTDGGANITAQKMGVFTPGGICNPVVTYGDLSHKPSYVPPIDPRIPANAPAPLQQDEGTPVTRIQNQSPIQPDYRRIGYSDF